MNQGNEWQREWERGREREGDSDNDRNRDRVRDRGRYSDTEWVWVTLDAHVYVDQVTPNMTKSQN